MARTNFFSAFLLFFAMATPPSTFSLRCASPASCNSLIDYVSPNATTLSSIQTLFTLPNLSSILAANNLPLSTLPTYPIASKQIIKILFPCICTNGTGISNGLPSYTVIHGDGLYHIAAEVFSGLITVSQIQTANNISNPDLILEGQKLSIPLPCSCDDVDGQKVMHYGHVVPEGSSVEGIAQEFNTSQDTLLRLNNLNSSKELMAGSILDVPLRACSSTIKNNSMDYNLLVPNDTYALTANNCVVCKCDAALQWVLQCVPSGQLKTGAGSCPSVLCEGPGNLSIGNSTSSGCNRTTCSYAGYNNQTILTTLALNSTCPAVGGGGGGESLAVRLRGWRHMLLLFLIFTVSVAYVR
ncbi:lysM domain-containing GPI-anchored protein 2-like isoform X2 [Primulina huaijiensis]|uniref:lysM domain-containing GPI-anchored protein 2-like isoform X2 n=1 Tax=Primulina huaijiensis TaxID=1492673 RepID=UPI003CC74CDA